MEAYPWVEHEYVFLLCEIIKAAPVPSSLLYKFVEDARALPPKWSEIPLPPGRSLKSCQTAFQELARTAGAPHGPTSGPQSLHIPLSEISRKRAFVPSTITLAGRSIMPKPHTFSRDTPSGSSYISSYDEPPQKRKRGRPTKAEAQARAEAAAARGEVYPPPKQFRQYKGSRASFPSEHAQGIPAAGPSSTAVTTPPALGYVETSSQPSSGKGRRGRPPMTEQARRLVGESDEGIVKPSHHSRTYATTVDPQASPETEQYPQDLTDTAIQEPEYKAVENVEEHRKITSRSYRETIGI